VINDLDPVAIDMARTNVIRNNLLHDIVVVDDDERQQDEKKKDMTTGLPRRRRRPRGIQLQVGDATHEMYMSRLSPRLRIDQFNVTQNYQKPQYDIIDLDPYGSAVPYMDGAIQAVVHGGLPDRIPKHVMEDTVHSPSNVWDTYKNWHYVCYYIMLVSWRHGMDVQLNPYYPL
jgi:hypothetical protein